MVELSIPPDRNAPTGTSAIDWPSIARASASSSSASASLLVGDGIAEAAADHVAIRPVAGQAEPILGLALLRRLGSRLRGAAVTVSTQPGGSLNTPS